MGTIKAIHFYAAIAFVIAGILGVAVAVTLVQAFRLARRRRQYGLAMQLVADEIASHQEHARERQEAYRRKRRREGHSQTQPLAPQVGRRSQQLVERSAQLVDQEISSFCGSVAERFTSIVAGT